MIDKAILQAIILAAVLLPLVTILLAI